MILYCDGIEHIIFRRYPAKYGQTAAVSNTKLQSGNYYTQDKTEDFKVFHNIPASSHLLANYDPFYSPLLSRIDTVFKQLGYVTEPCRERLVCQMYRSPAKFAPYSNLVSAQLSRSVERFKYFIIDFQPPPPSLPPTRVSRTRINLRFRVSVQ